MKFYVKTTKMNSKFTFTSMNIQNQCTPILLMIFYFEFKWLFVNVEVVF